MTTKSKNPFNYAVSAAEDTDGYHLTTLPIILNAMRNPDEWGVTNLVLRGDSEKVNYTVIAGLWELLHKLEDWEVDEAVQNALRDKGVKEEVIQMAAGRKFEGKVYAVRDGEVLFPGPAVRFHGPKWQIKWVESMFTNHMRRCSSVATKMARARYVMRPLHLALEAALRRSNDTDGVWTSRSAYIAGADATSNVKAGRMFNIPWSGTVDHFTMQVLMEEYFKERHDIDLPMASFFEKSPELEPTVKVYLEHHPGVEMVIDEESLREAQRWAYRQIIETYPENYTLLVDTIDPYIGVEDAIMVLSELQPKGYSIRIDSGDLAEISKWARAQLDAAGLKYVKIAPSGGLSAITVKSLIDQDCTGEIWMFGEYLQFKGELARDGATLQEPLVNVEFVSKYAGTSDGIWESMKLSGNPAKNSLPGALNRLRFLGDSGRFIGDVIVNENQFDIPENGVLEKKLRSNRPNRPHNNKTIPAGTQFYVPMQLVYENSQFLPHMQPLYETEASRAYHKEQIERLEHRHKRVDGSHSIYGVGVEHSLQMRSYEMSMDKAIVHKNEEA